MILALAGNPNCGKTTLFNALTGANARTGNFPGVTVTRSTGVCRTRPDVTLVALPGVYALRPFSAEERVTRAYLLSGEADAIISIADATCPARSLYLTLQLLELGVPVVLALNVMDALRAGGGAVDTAGQALGIPVVPVSAALGEGLDTLLDTAVRAAQGAPPNPWRALAPGAVQSCVRTLARVLADEARRARLPPVFAATQWLDSAHGDHAPEAARQAVTRMERETGLTRGEALPTARFAQVDRLTRFFTLPQTLPGHRRSARIDRVLTGRYTAYPAMAALLGGVCCLTFHVVGPCLSRLLAHAIAWLADAADGALLALDAGPLLRTLVREDDRDGIGVSVMQNDYFMRQSLISNGHTFAVTKSLSAFSAGAALKETLEGETFVRWFAALAAGFAQNGTQVSAALRTLTEKVFVTSRLFAGYSGALDAGVLARLIAALPQGAPGETAAHKRYDAAACAVEIPADVGFCALGHNLYALGSSYSGACPVLSSLVSYGYLWNMVRVQGGAYGTGMNVRRSGDIFCYSYRDPNLDNTRAVFSAVADFIENFAAQGMPLDDIIIGAVNTTDPLLDPAGVCESQCVRALKGVTPEDLAKTRHELLATKPADLAAMAGVLRKYAREGKFCTFSGTNGGA